MHPFLHIIGVAPTRISELQYWVRNNLRLFHDFDHKAPQHGDIGQIDLNAEADALFIRDATVEIDKSFLKRHVY